jgi:hypothetical protein
MSNNERRIVPRKAYAIPVRFNVITQEFAPLGARAKVGTPRGARNSWKRFRCRSKAKP